MALVKFGGGVAGLSGKIAGTVFARNKAGAFARNWAKPVNPVTPSQSIVRGIFANGSAGWSSLTPAQRDAWNGQAANLTRINRLGEAYKPSGRQYYLEIFNSLAQAGQPSLLNPVASPVAPNSLPSAVLTAVETAGALTTLEVLAGDSSTASMSLIVEAAPVQPDTKTNVNVEYRQIAVLTIASGPWPAQSILTGYSSLFGTAAAAGDISRVRITTLDVTNGLRSAPILLSAIVT